MRLRLFHLLLIPLLTACTGEVISPKERVNNSESLATCKQGECPCESPAGLIPNGQSITMYSAEKAACSSTCDSVAQTVTCYDGKLSVDTSSLFVRCELEACLGCLVSGNLIKHGEAAPFFSAAEAKCNETCEGLKTMRTCLNGDLKGSTTHTFLSCQQRSCKCELPANQGSIYLGQKIGLHKSATPACGETCQDIREERICEEVPEGASATYRLTGSNDFSTIACSEPTNCACTLPSGLGSLAHGGVRRLFMAESAACGETCNDFGYLDVTCSNGKLFKVGTSTPEIDAATTAYKFSCKQATCKTCSASGYTFPAKLTLFTKSSIGCFDQCADKSVQLECKDGTIFIGTEVATEAQTSGLFNYCLENCKYCDRGGVQMPTGSVAQFYKSIPISSAADCGKTCPSVTKKCVDGLWVGDPTYTLATCNLDGICNTEGGGAPPFLCTMPWGNKPAVYTTPGAKITVYRRNRVACSDSCANYARLAECDRKSGALKVQSDYIYPACREDCP